MLNCQLKKQVEKTGSVKTTQRSSRILFIDIAKGIGIILVICSHVYSPLMYWANPCYIPLFFVVSGYCTIRPIILKKKFKKLIIPYVLFTFILLAINFDYKPVNLLGAIYSRWCLFPYGTDGNIYFLRSGNGPLWFLTSMFSSFCLYKYINKFDNVLIYLLLCIVLTYALSFLPILLPWSLDTMFLMTIFIFAGSYIRQSDILYKTSMLQLSILIIIYIISVFQCGWVNLSVRVYGNSLLYLLFGAIIGSFILIKLSMLIERYLSLVGGLLSALGNQSLSIFCIHIPFISIWEKAISNIPTISPLIHGAFTVILVILTTYPLAIFFNKRILRYVYSRFEL